MMMTNTIEKLRTRKGIGLLELMLALAIIAVLIIMATRYYQSTSRNQKVAEAVTQVNALIAASSNWKIGRSAFTGITYAKLYAQGLLPKEMKTDTTATPWGTKISVASTAGNSFDMSFEGLDSADCEALAGRFTESANITTTATCASGKVVFTYSEKGTT